ncbi:MAG: FHA domain-containing protein, partial [Myxococcaceae bacterium]
MASSNRKRPPSAPGERPLPLPFDDEDIEPLPDSDPFGQYPASPTRRMRSGEEHVPTSVYDSELAQAQEELAMEGEGLRPAFLFVDRGPGAGQLVPVRQGSLVIGRASVSDLRLQHGSISRRHTQITRKGERFYIKDLGSQNGTYVNRMRIATELEIFPGDQIALGNALLKLRGPKEQAAAVAMGEPERHITPRSFEASAQKPRNALRIALFGGALGFGVAAVVMFAVLRPNDPTYQNAAKPSTPPPAAVKTEAPAAAPKPPADPVSEKINKLMAEKAKQESSVSPKSPIGSASTRRADPKPGRLVDDAPVPKAGGRRSAILSKYDAGDVAGALAMAKQAGDTDLATRISSFQARYDRAQDAMAQQDGGAAITHLKSALEMDKKISSGFSKFGTEIRRELSNLSVLAAQQFQKTGDEENAAKWYRSALSYNPDNATARAAVAKSTEDEEAAPAPAAKKSLDESFNDGA